MSDPTTQPSVAANLLHFFPAVRESFDQSDDLAALARIAASVRELDAHCAATLDRRRAHLRALARALDLSRARVADTEAFMRGDGHAPDTAEDDDDEDEDTESADKGDVPEAVALQRLDAQKVRLARRITDIETANGASAAALTRLNRELEALLDADIVDASAQHVQDSAILKLKVFQSLGVSFNGDGGPETHTKALIHSAHTNDIHTLSLDTYSSYFISNYIWDKL